MAIYVEVRVIGRADQLVIQRHKFDSATEAEMYVEALAECNARGGPNSGYYGTIITGDLPLVDLCADDEEEVG